VRIDRPHDDDSLPAARETRASRGADAPHIPNDQVLRRPDNPVIPHETRDRATYYAEYKARVQAEYRDYAVERGCDRVRETEETAVTPTMRRIEAEDPNRHLVGFEHRLKGRDRLAEKVTEAMTERARTANEAFATVKDAIRYTFQYADDRYTDGVRADCERLKEAGFEAVDRKNSWRNDEYKGINSRWRVPENGQLFEVQFHTRASFEAKQETHPAYEKLRNPATTKAEQDELAAFQRGVSSRIPIPSGATEIPDYR
jgi:hypothetical protein